MSKKPPPPTELQDPGTVTTLDVGKATKRDPDISPTPPLIFTGGQKVQNLASFSTSFHFERSAFENAARYLNSETNWKVGDDHPVLTPSLVKFGPRTLEILSCNVLNRQ